MGLLKTKKDIQVAAHDFRKAFHQGKASTLNGIFVPSDATILYKQHQLILLGAILCSVLFAYLFYNAVIVDAVYYWHVDLPVVVGLVVVFIFGGGALLCIYQYLSLSKTIQHFLEQPNQFAYGVIITDDYYFENTPTSYHIIPRANIMRIDHEETKPNGEIYLELMLDMGEHIEIRGVFYRPSEFDLKTWASTRPQSL